MAFSFAADKAGIATERLDTTASVRLAKDGDGFVIDRIALTLKAKVPGMDEAAFQKMAQEAKANCPLSKALASVPEITLEATLVQ
jgi:osmotically inducible protein OsmC